jgi:hypothetical protein
MDSVVNFEKASPKADLQKAERFLNMVPMAKRRTLYLHLTRQASLGNLVDLTKFAARRALRLSADGSQEAQLAALYNSIYDVVSVDTEQASATLRRLNPNLLPSLERKLLAASLAVTDEIRKPAEMERTNAIIPADEDLTSDITRVADTALSKADEMIGTSLQ